MLSRKSGALVSRIGWATGRFEASAGFTGLSLVLACLLLVAGCASMSGSGSSQDRMSSGLPSRIEGDYAADLPLHHVVWQRAATGDRVVADAFMADGLIFAITEDHEVNAIDANGTHRWVERLGKKPDYRPAINSDAVFFICDGDLVVVTRAHGERKVLRRLPFTPAGPPAAGELAAYIPAWDGHRIFAVDPHSGDDGWKYRFASPVVGRPVVIGQAPRQTVVAASEGGEVVALEALHHSATPKDALWAGKTLGPNVADLTAYSDEFVLVASKDTNLYAFERITGQRRWAFPAGLPLQKMPSVAGDRVFLPTEEGMMVLDLETGDHQWTHEAADRFVVRADDRVLLLDEDSRHILTLDVTSGEELESHDVSAYAFVLTNHQNDGRLYLATARGEMIALDGKTPAAQ